jgi:hypothetical protein
MKVLNRLVQRLRPDLQSAQHIVWVVASEHLYDITNVGLHIGLDGFYEVSAEKRKAK